jgi:hypothetical protein
MEVLKEVLRGGKIGFIFSTCRCLYEGKSA